MILPAQSAFVAVFAAALLAAPASAEVYRCTVEGVRQFSDQPCQAGDRPLALPQTTIISAEHSAPLAAQHEARTRNFQKARADEDAAWSKDHAARTADTVRIRDARGRGEAVIGMGAGDLRAALGEPAQQTSAGTAKGLRETWTYEDTGEGRVTVTLQDGIVTGVRRAAGRKAR